MTSIDGQTTGLSKEVYGTLKELQKARKGEALTEKDVDTVVKAMAKDGKIDQAELDLLDEMTANHNEVKLNKDQHDTKPVVVKFGQAESMPGLRDRALESAAEVARRSAMARRARDDRGASEIPDLKRILSTDQKLAGVNADGSKSKYGNKGDVATKILIQDGILLERKGLLTPDDQAFLHGAIEKRNGGKQLSPEDLQRLDTMVEKAISYLDGKNPEIKQVDQGSLIDIGGQTGGTPAEQYAKVDKNYGALINEADSAIHDVAASTSEVGLNRETLKAQKGADVEAGRSFERIAEAVEEADRQFLLLHDNVLPALKQQTEALKQQIDARMMELSGGKTIGEAMAAFEKDPALRDKARKDSKLQDLNAQHAKVGEKFGELSKKMLALDEARIKGVKTLASIKVIDQEMKERIASVKGMSGKLNEGITSLNDLRNDIVAKTKQIDGIGKQASEIENRALTGTTDQEQLDELKRKELELAGADSKLNLTGPELEAYKKRATAVCDEMITGMDALIQDYEASGTHNKKTVDLLKAERETLGALKRSFDKNFDPVKAVKDLEASRSKILGTLKKLVPQHLDIREYKALSTLDGKVSGFSAAHKDVKDAHDYATGRVTAARNSIGSARELVLASEEELKAVIERAEKGQNSGLEQTLHDMESMPETSSHKGGVDVHGGLSFGSHARVYLGLGVGVGADIGILEAKVAIGIEGALEIEKQFGSGPQYLMHADLAVEITGEVNLDLLLTEVGVSASIKAGLRKGLAFDKSEDAIQFGKDLASFVGQCMRLREAVDKGGDEAKAALSELKASMAKLEKAVDKHAYDSAFVESKVELEVESSAGTGTKVKAELLGGAELSSFADGSEVKDTHVAGLIQVGEFGLEVSKDESKVLKQPTTPGAEKRPDTWRTVVEFKVPASVLKEVMHHGSLAKLPKGVLNEVVKTIKASNPSMAYLGADFILKMLDKSIPGNKQGLAKMIAMGEKIERAKAADHSHHKKGPVKTEAGISIGISVGKNAHGKNFMAVEFNVEGSVDYKQDFGGGTNFVRLKAGAAAKVGYEIEVAWGDGEHHGGEPEKAGGHH